MVTSVRTQPFSTPLAAPACTEPCRLGCSHPPPPADAPTTPTGRSNRATALPRAEGKPPVSGTTPRPGTSSTQSGKPSKWNHMSPRLRTVPCREIHHRVFSLYFLCDGPVRHPPHPGGAPLNPSRPLQAQSRRKPGDLTMAGVRFKISSSGDRGWRRTTTCRGPIAQPG